MLYLTHDGPSHYIASSLGEFLTAWERLGWIGPESWILERFLDPASGCLDSRGARARELARSWRRARAR